LTISPPDRDIREGQIVAIRAFLNTILAGVPDRLEEDVAALRRTATNLKNSLESTEADMNRVFAKIRVLRSEVDYLVTAIRAVADVSTQINVIAPLLKELEQELNDEISSSP
jgi:seryl-tRNA synthetase